MTASSGRDERRRSRRQSTNKGNRRVDVATLHDIKMSRRQFMAGLTKRRFHGCASHTLYARRQKTVHRRCRNNEKKKKIYNANIVKHYT